MANGKIAYSNLATSATITATTEATGFEAANAGNWNLYDSWKGTHATQNILSFDLGAVTDVDYFAVFGHDVIDYSGTIKFQWSNDGATGWTDLIGTVTPADKSAIFKTFTSVNKRYFRVLLDHTGGAPLLSVVSFGEHLTLSNGFMAGFNPIGLTDDAALNQNISEDGIPLGRSTSVSGSDYVISQTNVTEAWVRSDWMPFIEAAKTQPFFVMWDETNFPLEVVFAWAKLPLNRRESVTHTVRYMSVSLTITGLHEI